MNVPESLKSFGVELERAAARDTRRRRRRSTRLVVVGAVAAALAATAALIGSDDGAGSIERAAAALAADSGAVLHMHFRGLQDNGDGTSATWESESWQQLAPPYARRQIETGPEGTTVETASYGGVDQLYDERTNTVYVMAPVAPEHGAETKPRVVVRVATGAQRKRFVVTATQQRAPARPATAPPELPFRDEALALLASGEAREAGRETVAGREAIRIVAIDGHAAYLVDAETFEPIEWTTRGTGGGTTLRFLAYEELPAAAATARLFDLRERHPSARVEQGAAAFAAAQARLFPRG